MKVIKKVRKFGDKIDKKINPLMGKVHKLFRRTMKKVWNNPIGRVVLIAAAVFVGGWALGAWSPSGMFGAGAGGGVGGGIGGGAGGAALTETPVLNPALIAGGGAQTGSTIAATSTFNPALAGIGTSAASTGGSAAAGTALASSSGSALANAALPTAESAFSGVIPATTPSVASTGVGGIVNAIKSAATGFGNWTSQNQLLAGMAMQGIGTALTPTPAEEAQKAQRRYWDNLNVGGLSLGPMDRRLERAPLRTMTGEYVYNDQGGLIERRLAARRNTPAATVDQPEEDAA